MLLTTHSAGLLLFSLTVATSGILYLQQQHLIELIRLRETEAALEFAQSQLAEQGEESRECLTEMERTLALLAFDNPEESPFGDLLNMMQRQKVGSKHISKAYTCLVLHLSFLYLCFLRISLNCMAHVIHTKFKKKLYHSLQHEDTVQC